MTLSISKDTESYDPNGLLAGDYPVQTAKVTLASSAALTAGAVLGIITASGKYLLSASAAVDGSAIARAVLVEDADASGGDVDALVYISGEFVADKLNFGTAHTAVTVEQDFRESNAPLFVKNANPV